MMQAKEIILDSSLCRSAATRNFETVRPVQIRRAYNYRYTTKLYNSLGYAANNSVPETHGAGGLGGGGGGGHNNVAALGTDGTLLAGEDGTPNTGGGGGGAGSNGAAGAGGSGIVIIRYLM